MGDAGMHTLQTGGNGLEGLTAWGCAGTHQHQNAISVQNERDSYREMNAIMGDEIAIKGQQATGEREMENKSQ